MHIHLFGTEEKNPMLYLDQLKLVSRPDTPQEGIVFIEQFILPTLELCKRLEAEKKIVAGGPLSGAVALSLIVNAESAQELDDLITSLPVLPRMEVTNERIRTIRSQHPGELCEFAGRGTIVRVAAA